MRKFSIIFITCIVALFSLTTTTGPVAATVETQAPTPLFPEVRVEVARARGAATSTSQEETFVSKDDKTPVRVSIPSIRLQLPVVKVGVNAKGEMDVPAGNTNNVGWYQYGTLPGEIGSAVFDAHVFAAFKNLHRVQISDEIEVATASGETLRFRVSETKRYPYDQVPPDLLFTRSDTARLNLITCAGVWLPALETYSERLVVYAVLVT
jgi:sortase (surface protein transpeptidase)